MAVIEAMKKKEQQDQREAAAQAAHQRDLRPSPVCEYNHPGRHSFKKVDSGGQWAWLDETTKKRGSQSLLVHWVQNPAFNIG